MVGHHLFMEDVMSDRTAFEIEMIAKKKAGIAFTEQERMTLHGDCREGVTGGQNARDEYQAMIIDRFLNGLWISKRDAREVRALLKKKGR